MPETHLHSRHRGVIPAGQLGSGTPAQGDVLVASGSGAAWAHVATPRVIGPFLVQPGSTDIAGSSMAAGTLVVAVWAITTRAQTTPTAGDALAIAVERDSDGVQQTLITYDLLDGLISPGAFATEPRPDNTSASVLSLGLAALCVSESHLSVTVTASAGGQWQVYALIVDAATLPATVATDAATRYESPAWRWRPWIIVDPIDPWRPGNTPPP